MPLSNILMQRGLGSLGPNQVDQEVRAEPHPWRLVLSHRQHQAIIVTVALLHRSGSGGFTVIIVILQLYVMRVLTGKDEINLSVIFPVPVLFVVPFTSKSVE